MVLYTPLDYQDVFDEDELDYQTTMYKGKMVRFRTDETGQQRLVQLLSTDPADYLATDFSPGAILPNEVVQKQS